MSKKRRNHSPEFKAKVALAAIKGDQSIAELSQRYNLAQNQIRTWKKQLLERSAEVFASGKGLAPNREAEIKSLQAKIGEITIENDFFTQETGHANPKRSVINHERAQKYGTKNPPTFHLSPMSVVKPASVKLLLSSG